MFLSFAITFASFKIIILKQFWVLKSLYKRTYEFTNVCPCAWNVKQKFLGIIQAHCHHISVCLKRIRFFSNETCTSTPKLFLGIHVSTYNLLLKQKLFLILWQKSKWEKTFANVKTYFDMEFFVKANRWALLPEGFVIAKHFPHQMNMYISFPNWTSPIKNEKVLV